MNVKITLFSVEEANRAASELAPVLERLVGLNRECTRLHKRIEAMSLALSGASPQNPDVLQFKDLVDRRRQVAGDIRKGVEDIQSRGAVVKDLDRGLVDFYSMAGDRLIFLCWHLGETEVSHWHTLEGGFANRQPLDKSELE